MKKLLFILLLVPLFSFSQVPKIDLEVTYENNQLIYNIDTNIPLPIEVMIGIEPKGLSPDEPAYGFSERVKIEKSPMQLRREAKDKEGFQSTVLKNGTYLADVKFYPLWGAKNGNPNAGKIKEKVVGTSIVEIGSFKKEGSIKSDLKKSKKQSWGMKVSVKDKWIEKKFIENLGKYQELETRGRDPKLVKTYYFPEADMTFFINKPLKQVLMWKFGKVDSL